MLMKATMAHAILNVIVVPKRMLTKLEAACHCGMSVKRFEIECPVQPIQFQNGQKRYDIHDLDAWIDSLTAGHESFDVESIIDRLK
jgi:hypothetical protein